jgi:glycosyltransferase involved in cell wall biosynthesis
MKIKICQIIPTLDQGGAEKQMALLARHLDPARFESHVIVLSRSGPLESQLREAGVHLHFIAKRFKADPFSFYRLLRALQTIRPHVVHTWIFAANSYGRTAAWWTQVPMVIAGERCVDNWKGFLHLWIDRFLAKKSDIIATNSKQVADFYQKSGISKDLFRVIPNAVEASAVRIAREDFFRRLNLQPRRFIIGSVGRLWPQKGYEDLIWAAELVRVALKDVWFVILGDGPQRQHLQKLRDQYGAQDAVRFAGHRHDAKELISSFDLLWNGSRYEGQSNAILEAMAAGVPVVASGIPENRDLVTHGYNGYLYQPGEVGELTRITCNLLPNAVLREELGQAGQRRAMQSFSLEAMVSNYTQLYDSVREKIG